MSAHIFLFLFERALLLFEREIPEALKIRCKKRRLFSKFVHNLGVETAVLSVTPEPEARQETVGSSCAHDKSQKNVESGKIKPHLESLLPSQGLRKASHPCGAENS